MENVIKIAANFHLLVPQADLNYKSLKLYDFILNGNINILNNVPG